MSYTRCHARFGRLVLRFEEPRGSLRVSIDGDSVEEVLDADEIEELSLFLKNWAGLSYFRRSTPTSRELLLYGLGYKRERNRKGVGFVKTRAASTHRISKDVVEKTDTVVFNRIVEKHNPELSGDSS